MNAITKYVVLLILCLSTTQINAQDVVNDSIKAKENTNKIKLLSDMKETIKTEEREFLKAEIEAINKRLERGEISQEKADQLKKEAAERRALNIENRIAIVDNKIQLLQRNDADYDVDDNSTKFVSISFMDDDEFNRNIFSIKTNKKPRKYDRRTTSDFVWAIGFNNTLIDGEDLDDSPYKLAGSDFVEWGWAWKTRLFRESNFLRLKYGFSFQWNKLDIKDNQYFVRDGDMTTLQEFPSNLKKAKFRVTNLVFPVHLEFGPSKKIERDTYFRYTTHRQFKVGIGGYAGFRIGTLQKLKYEEDGDRVKDKSKQSFNTSNFVYGLSTYVGVGNTSLYLKYDLNPLFKDQEVDQHNISLGLRFDFD